MYEPTSEELTNRIDAAIITFKLTQGKDPAFVRMSYQTFQHHYGSFVTRDMTTGVWQWRGVPINLRAMPLGEVEVV